MFQCENLLLTLGIFLSIFSEFVRFNSEWIYVLGFFVCVCVVRCVSVCACVCLNVPKAYGHSSDKGYLRGCHETAAAPAAPTTIEWLRYAMCSVQRMPVSACSVFNDV